MSTYTERVRQLLRTTGGMTLDQLIEALPDDADRNNVNTMCHQRCRAGEFMRSVEDSQTVFSLRQGGGDGLDLAASPEATDAARAMPTKPRARRTTAAATPDDNVRASLVVSHMAASDAIEAYVTSVGGDLAIYRSLVDARDNTRNVLANYITRDA
ncbi:hypothetical protein [Pinirhizobacter sp.]|jgi:hypothetical protein|uniref:hypothetical protein n=1 Tax=Pinirhizobacter sp. TaxID=2950432 RepID=UPI002F415070